jgi:uncharacterized membrane protein
MKRELTAREITIYALSIALVCVSTIVIQIPIPLGYMHLGNTLILLCAFLFGPKVGMAAGGIGSALADLFTGYAYWALPTLIIKGIMGFAIGYIANRECKKAVMMRKRTAVAAAAGIIIMIAGYFIAGSLLYGSLYTGALQIPGLSIEGVLGIALFYALGLALEKAGFYRIIKA